MRDVASGVVRTAEVPDAIQRAGPVVPLGERSWAWRAGRVAVGSGVVEARGVVRVSRRAFFSNAVQRTDHPFQPGAKS